MRDLGAWILAAVQRGVTGRYNVSGPSRGKIAFDAFVELCKSISGSDARLVWVDEEFLDAHGVQLWSDLPMRVPAKSPGFSTRSTAAAMEAGMRFRGPAETIRDTLGWGRGRELTAGLDAEREAALIEKWRGR